MILYRFTGVRSRTSPGPLSSTGGDLSAIDVRDAWEKIIDLLPCDGEWSCQLFQLGSREPRRLKSKTLIKVTEDKEIPS